MIFFLLIIVKLIQMVRQFFACFEEYLDKHNVPLRNITAVATNSAPAMVMEDFMSLSR